MNNLDVIKPTWMCSHYLSEIKACGPDRDCIQCLIDIDNEETHECQPITTSNTVVMPEVELITEEPTYVRQRRASLELTPQPLLMRDASQQEGESEHVCVAMSGGCVLVTMGNKCFPVLVDTGASVSFINPKLVSSLSKEGCPMIINKIRDKVSLADNKAYKVTHRVTLNIQIEGTNHYETIFLYSSSIE